MIDSTLSVTGAGSVIRCRDFDATLAFFTEKLGFRIDSIFPADNPAVAEISVNGLTLRLERSDRDDQSELRLVIDQAVSNSNLDQPLVAPNGTLIHLVTGEEDIVVPDLQPEFSVVPASEGADWIDGRAGMQYRDLIPGRLGGRFIASHIRIPKGGPVPDYVHFHKIRFQMIYCYRGWVRVVYEDQGEPFVLQPGDCVLQPPEIRHRVLECSDQLEVVEIGCPAEHITRVDHQLALPTTSIDRDRVFSGQRFVRHQAAAATWRDHDLPDLRYRDLGIGDATCHLAGARVLRFGNGSDVKWEFGEREFEFLFVLKGSVQLDRGDGHIRLLASGDAVTLPSGDCWLRSPEDDLEVLEVSLPG